MSWRNVTEKTNAPVARLRTAFTNPAARSKRFSAETGAFPETAGRFMLVRESVIQSHGNRSLQMSAASPAILRSRGLQRAARGVIPYRRDAGGHQHGMYARFRSARPQQRHEPSNPRPARYEIQDENARGIPLVVVDGRRQEVQQTRDKKKRHFRTSESFNYAGPVGFVLGPT